MTTAPASPSLVDAEVARLAERIRQRMRRSAEDIIEIGKDLRSVRSRLKHGEFGPWLDREFGWSERTAQNFMRVAEVFGGKSATVADLPARALYALASDSVPAEVRDRFVEQAERGEPVRFSDVREALRPSPSPTALPVEDIDGPPLFPRHDDRFAVVDRATGEIVGRAEPVGRASDGMVRDLPPESFRRIGEAMRDDARDDAAASLFAQLVRLNGAVVNDPEAVARAGLRHFDDTASAWAERVPAFIEWIDAVREAVERERRGHLRAVR